MSKKRLDTYLDFSFDVIGLVCDKKDHVLAWHLNNSEHFNFHRVADQRIEFVDNTKLLISNFEDSSDQHHYHLLKNKLSVSNNLKNQYLLPELKEFDFFIKLESAVEEFNIDDLISSLKKIKIITYLVKLNVDKIKQKENLLF